MGELVVNFSTLDLLTMNIDATVQQMNNRINDIGTMAGRISGVSTRRGYLAPPSASFTAGRTISETR